MTRVSSIGAMVGACATLLVVDVLDASAQTLPESSVNVVDGGPLTFNQGCGQPVSRTFTVKNTGNGPFNGKIVFNGVVTPLALAKGEAKSVAASGGNYDCGKSASIEVTIPNPNNLKMAPLWKTTYQAKSIGYDPIKIPVPGGDVHVTATGNCGSPMKVSLRHAGTGPGLPLNASIGAEKFTGTSSPNGTVTFTATATLSCSGSIPSITYGAGGKGGTLAPFKVSF